MQKLEREVTDTGHVLWRRHETAQRYAEARHALHGGRQKVTGELYRGRWWWRVTKARERVAEPCS